ncbi:GNAT family N-acetyltransferase [Tomitella gaofuii]|uniref:GNAT family N-acetyltransferase n=1 Tax=Tomitella gaofuii TaxID=2760083 RepID=UPI0015FB94FA|nr:GNAT family N-acetyltransferase [Tomitella gaofuii]
MTDTSPPTPPHALRLPAPGGMTPRDPAEEGRGSSPLELLFDLVFVVAVSLASAAFHSGVTDGRVGSALTGYAMVFFAIWWAWMNFTWFASAYDCDDARYRLMTLVQMAGVLILAAGMPDAMTERDFTLVVIGYVVMRIAMVMQWLRASRADPRRRRVALTYACGITAVQSLWVAWLFVPDAWQAPLFVVFAACELAVPALAERRDPTPWNPEHIADRYGSFTLIVLGETILASTNAIIVARDHVSGPGTLIVVSASALVLAGSVWWLYFDRPQHHLLNRLSMALRWGYGHYFVFGAVATLSVGIGAVLDYDVGATALSRTASSALVTVPIALFMIMFWLLSLRHRRDRLLDAVLLAGAAAVGFSALLPHALPVAAALTCVVTAAATRRARRVDAACEAAKRAAEPRARDGRIGQAEEMGTHSDSTHPDSAEPTVRHAPERLRYEIALDGEAAGFAAYTDADGRRIFYHTEIDERFGGRGLAGVLVEHALTDARTAGIRIVPVCPYVAKYVKTHHAFDDALDAVTPDAIVAAQAAARR